MMADLRYGIRQLRKAPGFALTAVLTLAVGIGGVTAVFSIVDAVLLRPLPYAQADRLVRLHEGIEHQFESANLPAPDVIRFARENRAFSAVAGFIASRYEVSGAGLPFAAQAERVTASLFPMLGAQPLLGRVFTRDEDEKSAPLALISYGLWREKFQGDAGVVGRTVDLDRQPYTIIGVMPRGFEFPLDAGEVNERDLWVPMSFTPDEKKDEVDNFDYGAIARLKPGATLGEAQADVSRMLGEIQAEIPAQYGIHLTSNVGLLQEETVHAARPLLRTLLGAVCLILLIACANLANLLLVRAAGRRREFGVRMALGAARKTMLRQLLVESLLLSAMGGALGLCLAVVLVEAAKAILPEAAGLPRLNEIAVHWPVAALALLLIAGTGVVCGLAPAVGSMKADVLDALRDGGQAAGQGRSHHRLRSGLVMVEVALAMMLLVGSGLLLRSFARMLETDPGFVVENLVTASLDLPAHDYATQEKVDAFYGELQTQLAAMPGVRWAGLASGIPIAGISSYRSFVPEGYVPQNGRRWDSASNYFVLGDYFRAMGIRLVEGRLLNTGDDRPDAPLVAVVSQTAAKEYWPGKDPVGMRLRMGGSPQSTRPLITIVGIVGDVHQNALDEKVIPQMYEPFTQFQRQFEPAVQASIGMMGGANVVVRSTGDAGAEAADLEKTVHRLDPLLAVTNVRTMDEVVAETEASRRFNTGVLTSFAAIALGLALLGIYGVLAYAVTERKREIAIRMALGATRRNVERRTLGQALVLALVGVAAGLGAALGLTRYLASLLYGVKPLDAATLAGAVVVLLACSALAAWIPAQRAASVEPMEALRSE